MINSSDNFALLDDTHRHLKEIAALESKNFPEQIIDDIYVSASENMTLEHEFHHDQALPDGYEIYLINFVILTLANTFRSKHYSIEYLNCLIRTIEKGLRDINRIGLGIY